MLRRIRIGTSLPGAAIFMHGMYDEIDDAKIIEYARAALQKFFAISTLRACRLGTSIYNEHARVGLLFHVSCTKYVYACYKIMERISPEVIFGIRYSLMGVMINR